jgi:phosphoenolpyruvate carboxylase
VPRDRVQFEAKDEPLRRDVGQLGALLGEVIREQCGEALFDAVERVRLAAIEQRESGRPCDAAGLFGEMTVAEEENMIRAFSAWFQVANLAERVHRVRRRKHWLRSDERPQPDSMRAVLEKLAARIDSAQALQAVLNGLRIEPVFTAHPTEPTRRTLLEKQQLIARRLVDLMNTSLAPHETRGAWESIREAITTAWQTREHPAVRMTVTDELEHALFFLTDVIYRIIPPFYESLRTSIDEVFPDFAADIRIPVLLRFGSWVGGDMDGNPNVSATTIRSTLRRHRAQILGLYTRELKEIGHVLSQSPYRIPISDAVTERIDAYTGLFPQVQEQIPPRHRLMPYRVLTPLIAARLDATAADADGGYANAGEFIADLETIADSLIENRGRHAGLFPVQRLIWRARTFGFHLATLDVRQDSLVHRQAVGRGLGVPDWLELDPAARTAAITEALADGRPPAPGLERQDPVLEVFTAIAETRRRYGREAIGPYIISMSQGPDDVLSVLLLAHWGGLVEEDGHIPLDVAPLFETVPDLKASRAIMGELLADPGYGAHLDRRERRQIVMIGYSDSNKDAGIASARWALQRAETELVEIATNNGVDLTLFHGRGGTISRGGGKTHVAVLAAPPGSVGGRLRVTEQGEIINAKYGLRGIAVRTLEQAAGSVALATYGEPRPAARGAWIDVMGDVADTSRAVYRSLVYDDPDFYGYFRQATPIDVIERMQIGSRPASRRSGSGIQDLRAIPWVFSWTQNRHVLPGWYGLGTALEQAIDRHGEPLIAEMFNEWLFVRALLEDVEMVLAKADMGISERYAELADERTARVFGVIRAEFDRTVELILRLKGADELLAHDPTLQRAIRLRNPYVDPMSLLQVDLLRRWRAGDRQDDDLLRALLLSVNGIAHGLQNTG